MTRVLEFILALLITLITINGTLILIGLVVKIIWRLMECL